MGKKKTALEKMDHPGQPEVKTAPEKWVERFGGEKMLIPSPRLVAEILNQVPSGQLISMGQLRDQMALSQEADFSCPLTSGIFARIVAEASEEAPEPLAPWWRLIKDNGQLNPKFPEEGQRQAALLEEEGISVVPKRKHLVVPNWEQWRVNL